MVLVVSPEDEQLLCVSDAGLHPIYLEQPDCYTTVDLDPAQVEVARLRIITKIVTEKTLVLAFYFLFPGLSYVVHKGEVMH